ncbi:MAG: hypothetical protein KAH14_00615, partial [Clostridiales bacterium]|nr:hypothetical protein [Clostridiales bacterium]
MTTGFILAKADYSAFIKQYTIYKVLRNNNRFNLGANSIKMSIEDDQENYRFIYLHKKQIGGVILS